jgi:hypothetical protein
VTSPGQTVCIAEWPVSGVGASGMVDPPKPAVIAPAVWPRIVMTDHPEG